MRHIVFEGLPAVGKSELLQLLARFYPHTVRVLPELVKDVVQRDGLDLFKDRAALTAAIRAEVPRRRQEIQSILDEGYLCLEESHLGVHYAYARALEDLSFLDAYPSLESALPVPDCYVLLDIPPDESAARQAARNTPSFTVAAPILSVVDRELALWHQAKPESPVLRVDSNRPAHCVVRDVEAALSLPYGAALPSLADTFDILLLLGRPASGKSEFIDFLSRMPAEARARTLHMAPFHVVDDFPLLWEKFLEDDGWEALGRPRLHSKRCDGNYAVTSDDLWAFLIDRVVERCESWLSDPTASERGTLVVEFSRGGGHGYREALGRFPPRILVRAAVLYVSVSFSESWRRNLARYVEKEKDGILTHSVPREEMERTYGTDDWEELTGGARHGMIQIGQVRVPYFTMSNEPESTDPAVLEPRYREALDTLHAARLPRRA
jgi:thymidylate kinase